MLTLREFQQRFAASLFDDGEPDPDLAHCIQAGGLSAERRVGVYRNNLKASLTASLGATYPAIRALVGDEFFRTLARRYIREHPSASGDLHAFGECFESFLADAKEAASLPWIADLAQLEWSYHRVFHAAEEPALGVAELARFDAADHDRLVLRLHPASAPVASRFPLTAIWHLGVHGNEMSGNVDLDTGPEYLLVARRELEMGFQSLSRAEHAFVETMAAGRPLVECAAAAFDAHAQFDIRRCLERQFTLGNITGVKLVRADAKGTKDATRTDKRTATRNRP